LAKGNIAERTGLLLEESVAVPLLSLLIESPGRSTERVSMYSIQERYDDLRSERGSPVVGRRLLALVIGLAVLPDVPISLRAIL
jgi:hypothetical protein